MSLFQLPQNKNLENDQPWNYVWNYNNSDMQDKVQYFYPCVCVCVWIDLSIRYYNNTMLLWTIIIILM